MAFNRSNTAEQLPVATEETGFQNQDPIVNPVAEPVSETKSKKKGKGRSNETTETQVEVPVSEPIAEAVVEVPVETAAPEVSNEPVIEEPVATATAEVETKAEQTELEKFRAMSTEEVWASFGGYDKRGVISQAIRHLDAIGMPRSEIATKLGKRYQHVRNVLSEPVKKS